MKRAFAVVPALAALAALAAPACGGYGGTDYPDSGVPSGVPGAGVGAACTVQADCRQGLTCNGTTCQPCSCTPSGSSCVIDDECSAGLRCSPLHTCVPAGTGAQGGSCKTDADCAAGLKCDIVGLSAECKPEGTVDVGGACGSVADCYGGLACVGGKCTSLPQGSPPYGLPSWAGETCNDATGATQAYFHVPRGNPATDGDFYRLPFPNDVRLDGGKVSLTGHPRPGSALLGFDVVDRYIQDIQSTVDGFSAYPTIYFRFSAPVDLNGTLKGPGAVRFFDISQPATPVDLSFGWVATTDRNAYICNNWMGVRPAQGQPLTPGHTYAVVLASTVLDGNHQPITQPTDLAALLGATAPTDPALAAQYAKYAPLRAWMPGQKLTASQILNATVFTVGHPNAIGTGIATAVAAAPAPTATGWIRCGDAPSPCPQATADRACGTPDPAFDELHAMVTLPIFQQGTEPYLTPTDGGDVAVDTTGAPKLQRSEPVCMAVTVPKGAAMPAGGWPLLVYAHGTGGSFRSHVGEGVAKRMAALGIAVLGIDQVEHGTRRGASQESPDNLVYNFANPLAARGNMLQGAADQMALVRFATGFDLAAASSPTKAEIKVGALAFWGHSQGATEGGIAMPYTGGVTGVVLSGEGASLIDALVTKKSPVDVADVLPAVLEDTKVDANHPVLALLQNDLDRVDPLEHALYLVAVTGSAAEQKHVFQPYGQGDTYAPPVTEATFAIAARLQEATAPAGVSPDAIFSGTPLAVPASGNATVQTKPTTAILRQYKSDGSYDGHFVAYKNVTATADVDRFLSQSLAGKVPAVGP
jgi:hypothetical protein